MTTPQRTKRWTAGLLVLITAAMGLACSAGSRDTPLPVVQAATSAVPTPTPTKAGRLTIPKGLVGSNALIASDRLEALGFTNIVFGSVDSDATVVILPQNWTVTKVEPAAGTKVAADSTIVLSCTKKR